ncbi:MAG: aminoacyl-tRNA hydrolase [Litorivicinus sp.]
MASTFLIAGLGNPGSRYDQTRHNAGFWFLDALAKREGLTFRNEAKFHGLYCKAAIQGTQQLLIMPSTFMNRSGQSVGALAKFFKIPPSQIIAVHDELDLPPGTMKFKTGGGHGGHNGLRDIHAHLGSADYHRLRLGIGHPGNAKAVADYVLKAPSIEDRTLIDGAIDEALRALPLILDADFARATNQINGYKP